ncbi:MAG: hypothetical protein ACKVXR_04945 [Planctomycetota bacterium]
MLRSLLPGCALVLGALSAQAQSINIDFGPADSPAGSPSPAYGGSAGSPGVWNPVSTTSVSNLRAYDGTPTGVSLSTTAVGPDCGVSPSLFYWTEQPETSGDDEKLLDDGFVPQDNVYTLVFQGLAPGVYEVDTILVRSPICIGNGFWVQVIGSPDPAQIVHASWQGYFAQGGTTLPMDPGTNFARHSVTVTNGTLEIRVEKTHPANFHFMRGIQLNLGEQDYVGTNVCFGDGSVAPCPCVNSGQTKTGCQNSHGTGGSWLFASGSVSPDTIVLHAAGELPNALSIFWQGNAVIPPIAYGDGLRCAGGTLRRLYTKNASSGVVFAPAMGDPSITAQSAAIGVPIPPGGRRYYQVSYRDGNPSFCPSPTGNTFNISNAVRINW